MNSVKRQWLNRAAALILPMVLISQAGFTPQPAGPTKKVFRWARFEAQFTSSGDYENPLQDVRVEVDFTSPTGKTRSVEAFWYGARNWKVRLAPEETGKWTYRSRSSKADDAGLNGQSGSFDCAAYSGRNPLYLHGGLKVSDDRRYLAHADGTPFFWLGDTAWNGVLKADPGSWDLYLRDRVAKGFNVVQYVTTQWRTASGNADGRPAFYGREKIAIDPVFYQWMDERVDAMNDLGVVAAPVLIWAIAGATAMLNPGNMLPDDQIITLARYMVARYGAHHVVWFLAGDADYRGEKAERWKKIGRAVFGSQPDRLATMHPGGRMWVADEFRDEPWFSFNGYQSGHNDSAESMRWHAEGPPSQGWKKEPHHPEINLEPNYEAHIARPSMKVFDAHAVRRAAYWSLLIAPPAGVSYGGHGIWSWELKPNPPMTHPYTGTAPPWHEAMKHPGSTSMKHLKDLFSSLDWWRLRPDQDALADQPGRESPDRFIAAARSENGDAFLAYIPEGGKVAIKMDRFKSGVAAHWFNPATGARSSIGRISNQGTHEFAAEGGRDWVLLMKSAK